MHAMTPLLLWAKSVQGSNMLKLTPNVRKLVAHHSSTIAIPKGGGLDSAIRFLTGPDLMKQLKESVKWVETAIHLVRTAAEPNPFKTASDEEIAGHLVKMIEERYHKAKK